MSRIDGFNQILSQLRSRLTERSDRSQQSGRTAKTGHSNRQTGASDVQSLETQIKGAISGLDLSATGDLARARQYFIESILLTQFGAAIANDPGFLDMVQEISSAISQDTRLSSNLDSNLRRLGAPPDKAGLA